MSKKYKTLKMRVKDRHNKALNRMARDVNYVWNYCNQLSQENIRRDGKFLTRYEMNKYTGGASSLFHNNLPQQAINAVGTEYVLKRMQSIAKRKQETPKEKAIAKAKAAAKGKRRKPSWRLRYRKSSGVDRNTGWIPITAQSVKVTDKGIKFAGQEIRLINHRGIDKDTKIKSGSFVEDNSGRWFVCAVVECNGDCETSKANRTIGIDPGCKSAFTTSDGDVLEGRWYRDMEEKLAVAQRAKRTKRVAAIHKKIANRRADALHKFSTDLVNTSSTIYMGDASSVKLAKTRVGKSVLDAGWGKFRSMLEYKSDACGVKFESVNEAYSTVTCSSCKERTGPTGHAGLSVREWVCTNCGANHDRDINAAINIRNYGCECSSDEQNPDSARDK